MNLIVDQQVPPSQAEFKSQLEMDIKDLDEEFKINS
jgi:hypothetical protein